MLNYSSLNIIQEMLQKLSEKAPRTFTPDERKNLEIFGPLAEQLQDIQEHTRPFENVPDAVYQLKITLYDSKPPIWRRIQVKNTITLATLHNIIQIVMGWEDCHLYEFERGKRPYIVTYRDHDPDEPFGDAGFNPEGNVYEVHLKEALAEEKQKLTYLYDMGDAWEHVLLLEKILPVDDKAVHPICLKSKGACPPEDFGGIWAYREFLEALPDKKHSGHQYAKEQLKEWFGGDFNPDDTDIEDINQQLKQINQ